MLDKPILFFLINFISYFLFLSIFDFQAAFPLSISFSLFIVIYNYRKIGFKSSLVLAIIYLLAFDNEVFYFSDFNIRVWYFYLVIVYVISSVDYFNKPVFKFKKSLLFDFFILFIFFIWSIYFLIIEDFISKINNIKYWIFYIGLILVLNRFFKKNLAIYNQIINYIISITVFVMVWGILQFITNFSFYPNFQLDYFNIRPSAFFSETTWYSEYIFFGLILVFLKILTIPNMMKLMWLVPLFIVGFLISVTRNTFLSFFLYLVTTFFLTFFIEKKIIIKIAKSRFVGVTMCLIIVSFFLFAQQLSETIPVLAGKFTGEDESAQGRIEAYHLSIKGILDGGLLGNGYYWDSTNVTSSGSALGSKSFNILLMVSNIFGLLGGLLFFSFIVYYLIKILYNYFLYKNDYIKYSFIVFFTFVQMALFAPIHQFPFGMLVISLSVFLLNIGVNTYKKNNIYNSSV